ncbi:MAG: TylF/MycF family methyltransferase [Blastocatellia bacterium]
MNPKALYIDLMKRCLTFSIWGEVPKDVYPSELSPEQRTAWQILISGQSGDSLRLMREVLFDPARREIGYDHPSLGHTMIGLKRMENLQFCVESALANNVPGDLMETGVWRGGSTIFMRAILKAWQITNRKVWVADSFQGLPPPDEENYPADKGDTLYQYPHLAVSMEQVKQNFDRYGLLDDQVGFIQGWFKDSLPTAPVNQLAVLRLDGDMYESTMDALKNLYPKLSPGGYLIVDDYGYLESCRQAVHDYRNAHNITDPIHQVDWTGVYWQRS